MPNGTVRIGIVGCGAVAKKYVAAISRIEGARLAGMADEKPERAHALADNLPIPTYSSAEELAEAGECDAFVVATPSGDHANQVVALAKFGKHLIVEKPLTLTSSDGQRMIEEVKKFGCQLFVVKQNRCNPPAVWLKRVIAQGRIGRPVSCSVRVWWSRDQRYYDARPWRGTSALDGGVLANQASHHIDMMLWLMGEATEVMAFGARRLFNIETEDTAKVIVRFASGALGSVEATTATRPRDIEGSITILGDQGAISLGGFFMNQLNFWQFSDVGAEDAEIAEKWASTPNTFAWSHEMYLREVLASIENRGSGGVDAKEAMRTVQFVEAARKSMETGVTVHLAPAG